MPTTSGDGGHIWPPRYGDPRIQAIIDTGSLAGSYNARGIEAAMQEALSLTSNEYSLDDLWNRYKVDVLGVTDTSEPSTPGGFILPSFTSEYTAGQYQYSQVANPGAGGDARGIAVTLDGNYLYTSDRNANRYVRQTMSTPGDISTMGSPIYLNELTTNPFALHVHPDGDILYTANNTGGIFEVDMSTPYDITTGTLGDTMAGGVLGCCLSPDGTKAYRGYARHIYQHTLSTPYDLSTASSAYDYDATAVIAGAGDPYDLVWSSLGTYCFVIENTGGVSQFTCSTPFDLQTVTDAVNLGLIWSPLGSGSPFLSLNTTDNKNLYLQSANQALYQYKAATENFDPFYDDHVALLLDFEGTDGATTLTDKSPLAATVTFNGNAELDTSIKKYGTASGIFDGGATTEMTVPCTADFAIGTGDFCFEVDIYFDPDPGALSNQTLMAMGDWNLNLARGPIFDFYDNNLRMLYTNTGVGGVLVQVAWNPAAQTWYKICYSRYDGHFNIYVDGTRLYTTTIAGAIYTPTDTVNIGNTEGLGKPFVGQMDNLRFTSGKARRAGATYLVEDYQYPAVQG